MSHDYHHDPYPPGPYPGGKYGQPGDPTLAGPLAPPLAPPFLGPGGPPPMPPGGVPGPQPLPGGIFPGQGMNPWNTWQPPGWDQKWNSMSPLQRLRHSLGLLGVHPPPAPPGGVPGPVYDPGMNPWNTWGPPPKSPPGLNFHRGLYG